MSRRFAFAAPAALILLAIPALAAPPVTTFTLENGLRGVVIEDHRAPVVTNMVWYPVGAADEPPGSTGVAHFLEHLMFKGTDEIAEGEFSKIIAANGGQDNAFTSFDYTAYFQRIAADRLEMVMKMEADRMVDLRFDEAAARTERDVILEERSQRVDTDPGSQLSEELWSALYRNHPYGKPVIGWRDEIAALTREDALDFYRRFYSPDNAILVVAGDVDPAAVEALAKTYFGPLKPSGARPPERPQEPPHRAAVRVELQDARVRQPYVSRLYPVPSYPRAAPGEGPALAVLSEILGGGGVVSRLGGELQLGQRLAISTGASYSGIARDDSRFGVYAVPAEGVALPELEAAMDAVIARFIADGPTAAELERAKTVIIADDVYEQDSQSSLARSYGAALTVGLTVEDVQGWPDRVEAVTAEEVRRAAETWLRIEASATGYLTAPAAAATDAGDEETPG